VVVLSADATEGQKRRLMSAGAAEYLTKPLDVARFLEVLDEALGVKETVA
jgi:CheY-like chemotaxis protein